MQRIEKWRIKELALVLNRLVNLLKKGDQREWANVFAHFYQETQELLPELDFYTLQKLIQNIKNCYEGSNSFASLILDISLSGENEKLNREFFKARTRLYKILLQMEEQGTIYIH